MLSQLYHAFIPEYWSLGLIWQWLTWLHVKLCCNRILYCLVLQIGLMMSGFPKLDMIQEITGDSRSVKFFSLFLIAELNQNPVSSDVAAQCNQVNSYNFFCFTVVFCTVWIFTPWLINIIHLHVVLVTVLFSRWTTSRNLWKESMITTLRYVGKKDLPFDFCVARKMSLYKGWFTLCCENIFNRWNTYLGLFCSNIVGADNGYFRISHAWRQCYRYSGDCNTRLDWSMNYVFL